MKKVTLCILLLGVIVALLPGFSYLRNSNSDLANIYISYAEAVQHQNLDEALKYTSSNVEVSLRKAFDISDQAESQKRWDLFKDSIPTEVDFGAAIKEEAHAVLRIEYFGTKNPTITSPRIYGTVYFLMEEGKWKLDKISLKFWIDPTPTDSSGKNISFSHYWYPQFHANHTQSPSECAAAGLYPDKCYTSWAILNLDASLCENLLPGRNPSIYGPGVYFQCASTMAQLTGNEQLCDYDSPEFNQLRNVLEGQIKFCKRSLSDTGFLQKTNIYAIDSDNDGLTDLQESYFNTSLASQDTDQDGALDGTEVKNDTNPLGQGKLGDHLLQ